MVGAIKSRRWSQPTMFTNSTAISIQSVVVLPRLVSSCGLSLGESGLILIVALSGLLRWLIGCLCVFSPKLRVKRRSRRKRRLLITDLLKWTPTKRTRRTSSACATLKRHSTTLSFTLPISQAEKPTLVSPEAWRSRLTERNRLHMLVSATFLFQTLPIGASERRTLVE